MLKKKERLQIREYQEINDISERTASRELSELVKNSILEQAGSFGAGSYYQLRQNNASTLLNTLESEH